MTMKLDKFDKIAMSAYSAYRKECPGAPEWEELSNWQRDGFKAGAVHFAASMVELRSAYKGQRYVIKPDNSCALYVDYKKSCMAIKKHDEELAQSNIKTA